MRARADRVGLDLVVVRGRLVVSRAGAGMGTRMGPVSLDLVILLVILKQLVRHFLLLL